MSRRLEFGTQPLVPGSLCCNFSERSVRTFKGLNQSSLPSISHSKSEREQSFCQLDGTVWVTGTRVAGLLRTGGKCASSLFDATNGHAYGIY